MLNSYENEKLNMVDRRLLIGLYLRCLKDFDDQARYERLRTSFYNRPIRQSKPGDMKTISKRNILTDKGYKDSIVTPFTH